MTPQEFLQSYEAHKEAQLNKPDPAQTFVESQFASVTKALAETAQSLTNVIKEQKTVTVDNLPNPTDNKDVVKAVKGLEKSLKPVDNTDIVKAVKALQADIKKLPSAMPDSEKAVVQGLESLTQKFSSEIAKLLDAIKSQDLKPSITVPAPKVTVQPTPVKVEPTDLTGLIKAMEKVKKAVEDKPIPVANTPTNPLIKFTPADIEDPDGGVQYFGYIHADGSWYIRKFDTSISPKTIRFAFGTANYTTNWTNRASLTYALWSQ